MCDPTAALSLAPKLLTKTISKGTTATPGKRLQRRAERVRADQLKASALERSSTAPTDRRSTRTSTSQLSGRKLGSENKLLGS